MNLTKHKKLNAIKTRLLRYVNNDFDKLSSYLNDKNIIIFGGIIEGCVCVTNDKKMTILDNIKIDKDNNSNIVFELKKYLNVDDFSEYRICCI